MIIDGESFLMTMLVLLFLAIIALPVFLYKAIKNKTRKRWLYYLISAFLFWYIYKFSLSYWIN